MELKTLRLRAYKLFEDLQIDFNPKMNVIVGANGAGKTSILEAIIKNIYSFTGQIINDITPHAGRYLYTEDEINHKSLGTFVKLDLYDDQDPLPIYVGLGNLLESEETIISDQEQRKKNFRNKYNGNSTAIGKDVPVIKMYPATRINNEFASRSDRVYPAPQLESWANILDNSFSSSAFFKWFFDMENSELREQRDKGTFNTKNPKLDSVRKAITKAFKFLNGKEYQVSSFQEKRAGTNTFVNSIAITDVATGYKESLSQKSAGEKAVITLLSDIVYNLVISKSTLPEDIFQSKALILIDEIDAHLHPTWQRKIIPLLSDLFPNIQFVVTTHSPQVISSVSSDDIFVLNDGKIYDVKHRIKGLDTNSILRIVFDSTDRPVEYLQLVKKIDEAIENNKSVEEVEALINQVKVLDEEDNGDGTNPLISDLNIQLESYKYELAYEANQLVTTSSITSSI